MNEAVAAHLEGHDRRVLVGELRLLHQQDVGLRALEPFENAIHACFEGVDVPRRNAHPLCSAQPGPDAGSIVTSSRIGSASISRCLRRSTAAGISERPGVKRTRAVSTMWSGPRCIVRNDSTDVTASSCSMTPRARSTSGPL